MIRVAFVEDEDAMREQLTGYVKRYEAENPGSRFEVSTFYDGEAIVSDYQARYDIIFMDIKMRHLDGMQTAERIRALDKDVIIIFVTNMVDYAIRGYAVGAMDFVLKPVPYFAFSQQLSRAVARIKSRSGAYVIVRTEGGMRRLRSDELRYVEFVGRKLVYHTRTEALEASGSMKDAEAKLAPYHFYRCNNGYLVNLAEVEGVNQYSVIVGGEELQISRPRKKAFMEALADYVGGVAK